MAIYSKNAFLDYYEVDEELQALADGVGVVCAEGQPILNGKALRPKYVQSYMRGVTVKGELLAYPGGEYSEEDDEFQKLPNRLASPVEGLEDEIAVWMVGTAFAISKRAVLTAWHVVEDVLNEVDSEDPTSLRVVFGYRRRASARSSPEYAVHRVARATRLERDDEPVDVGLLELREAVPTGWVLPLLTQPTRARDGDAVHIIGHPLGQMLKVGGGKIGVADPHHDRSVAHLWASAAAGNSGSPVIWKGEVLGVFTSGDWPHELVKTKSGKWDHYQWSDRPNGVPEYSGTALYVADLV